MSASPMDYELPPQEDYIDKPSTDALLGAEIEYTYTRGNRYRLTFDENHHVSFDMLDYPGKSEVEVLPPPLNLPYRARKIRDDLYLVHWRVKEAAIHVSLTIDLAEHKLHAAAMMPPNRWEFFDTAVIEEAVVPRAAAE